MEIYLLSIDSPIPANNGAVFNIAQLVKAEISSVAEAETGAIFLNARESTPALNAVIEMGHPQGKTPIQTDNFIAYGVVNNNMQCKRSKSWDMALFSG